MAIHPKEAAILFALNTGLKLIIAPGDEVFVRGVIACGYAVRDRKTPPGKLSQFGHDGDVPYGLHLTDEGKRVAQLMKNQLADMGILDINESRPMREAPIDVTPVKRRIAAK